MHWARVDATLAWSGRTRQHPGPFVDHTPAACDSGRTVEVRTTQSFGRKLVSQQDFCFVNVLADMMLARLLQSPCAHTGLKKPGVFLNKILAAVLADEKICQAALHSIVPVDVCHAETARSFFKLEMSGVA